MPTEIVMPRLSDTMESGTVAKWLKHEGDQVKRGEVIAEIETDKANMDMESYADGILARISVQEGQSIGVGQPIAVIAANQEEAQTLGQGQAPSPKNEAAGAGMKQQVEQTPPEQGAPAAPQVDGTEPNERLKASPLARRIAQEHAVDLQEVAGTGPGGRITKEDVQSFLKQVAPIGQIVPRREKVEVEVRPSPLQPTGPGRDGQAIEMSRMQETIARRLTSARFSAPDFLLTAEFDMTEARQLLENIAGVEAALKIGPNDLLIRASAVALAKHPEANAGWEEDRIVRYGNINVGFAVAITGGGLIVPVVRNADRKSLGQIASEAKSLRDRAREAKLAPAEYADGTFTISNLGMYGIDQFTSILNPPEACSLAVGAIIRKPVVVGEELEIRDRMRVTLTCDHRVINGAQGAEFLQTLRHYLEHPALALL